MLSLPPLSCFHILSFILLTLQLSTLSSAANVKSHPNSKNKRSLYVRDGIEYTRFEHLETRSTVDYVTNSGVCETTEGVNQYSGYLNVAEKGYIFFWFFEARSNPKTAPLATWNNGGPGSSSMIGLFQENGPCNFANLNATEPQLNPYSWNEYANMLYIDQPLGVGFSYGSPTANNTVVAAEYFWIFLQAFYDAFPEYESRELGLWTESYGGHYIPRFASYIESQNAAITAGTLTAGTLINLTNIGLNNGWIDPKIQYPAYIDYAYSNPYRPLFNKSTYDTLLEKCNKDCLPLTEECNKYGLDYTSDAAKNACIAAGDACLDSCETAPDPYADYDYYDIRSGQDDPFPYTNFVTYLMRPDIMKKIGARQNYTISNYDVNDDFYYDGDNARSFRPDLTDLVDNHPALTILIWVGNADYICNEIGVTRVVNAISPALAALDYASYTASGIDYGTFKTLKTLSYLVVKQAGHEIPAYQPEVSLQAFIQTMQGKAIYNT